MKSGGSASGKGTAAIATLAAIALPLITFCLVSTAWAAAGPLPTPWKPKPEITDDVGNWNSCPMTTWKRIPS